MGVYIAGSSKEIDRVERWRDALMKMRIVVTSTWTDNVRKVGEGNPRSASTVQRRTWAAQCCREVERARVLWVLVPQVDAPTRGAWFEAGVAYTLVRPIVWSGDTLQSVFCALGDEHNEDAPVEPDAAAFHHVLNLVSR